MQGVTNAAPPSGGLRILRQAIDTVQGVANYRLSSAPAFAIVSLLDSNTGSYRQALSTAIVVLGDVCVSQTISSGQKKASVALVNEDGYFLQVLLESPSDEITIQHTVFG